MKTLQMLKTIAICIIFLLLTACATAAPAPILTTTPTASPQPTASPTPNPLVISVENAASVTQLAQIGKGRASAIVLSQDGKKIIVGSTVGVYIYDLEDESEPRLIPGAWVNSVSVNSEHDLVAASDDYKTARIWNMGSGKLLHTFDESGGIPNIAFNPDGELLALVSTNDLSIKLWDVKTGQLVRMIKVPKGTYSIAFSPDGKRLVSGGDPSYDVHIWDVKTGQLLYTNKGHTYGITSFAFSPDGNILASGSWDKTIRLWNAKMGTKLRTIEPKAGEIYSVAFSPDGRILATRGNSLMLWDIATGKLLRTLGKGTIVGFSPDGHTLVTKTDFPDTPDGFMELLDVDTGDSLKKITGYLNAVYSVAFSPDGQTLASGNYPVRLWDVNSLQPVRTFDGNHSHPEILIFSPNGQTLAGGGLHSGGPILAWNVNTGKTLYRTGNVDSIRDIAFSPDGNTLVSAGGNGLVENGRDNPVLQLLDANTGKLISTLDNALYASAVNSAAFSPNGDLLATEEGKRIKLWDAQQGKILHILEAPDEVSHPSFSPDGRMLVSRVGKTIQIWDVASWQLIRAFDITKYGVKNMAFSPDSHILAIASGTTIQLYNLDTGQTLQILKGHTGWANDVDFSSDGRLIVSGSNDGTIRFWGIPESTQKP